jgi:hypothetical protein
MEGALLKDTLRALDASIDELASNGDFDGLASLLAADFWYNHLTRARQDKAAWLEGLKALVRRRQRVPSSIHIELQRDLAVAMGDLDIIWTGGRHQYDRYVRVYRLQGGKWLAVSQRTVPAPDRALSDP